MDSDNGGSSSTKKKITLGGLVLMIFSSVFGFSNSLTAFYQMGYASIIWYIFAAIVFFLPVAMMMAEYGATFKAAKGGIFSWLSGSIGEKPAFIGTFIWLASWVVWLVSSTQYFLVSVSTTIFGHDQTSHWSLFGLSSLKTLGILEVAFILVVTFFASRGINNIAKVTAVGGFFSLAIPVIFIVASFLLLILNGGHLAQPMTGASFIKSPNPQFQTPIAIISFVVYAIFAYGGLETMGGITDSLDNPEKTFPRGLTIAMVVMTSLYLIAIVACGFSANWLHDLGGKSTNLANVEYVLINNLGVTLGDKLGFSHAGALLCGKLFSQLTALSDVLGGLGAAFVMVYSPVKSMILGCDPRLLPKFLTKLNKHDMPEHVMWIQAGIVTVIVLAISFGGKAANTFYTILTDMMNVSSSAPYLFLVAAFPFFKMKKGLDRPFVFFKSVKSSWIISIIVWLVVAIGIIFTCVEPILQGDPTTAFWTAFGPVLFGIIGWILYDIADKHAE